jgi:hypothetical protein
VVTTAHRALVHDCFEGEQYARGNGAVEVAILTGGLIGLAAGGLLIELALWMPFVLAAVAGCPCSPGLPSGAYRWSTPASPRDDAPTRFASMRRR